jgi:hypothetical protein
MGNYLADTIVTIYPFTQQADGEEVIIGNATNSSFLSLPPAAVEILVDLATGKTVGEAQVCYEEKYGENPDIEDFLNMLELEGFVAAPEASGEADSNAIPTNTNTNTKPATQPIKPIKYHFQQIPQSFASKLCSWPVLVGCGLIILAGISVQVLDSSLWPHPSDIVFTQNLSVMSLGLLALTYTAIFLHEMAHLVAARAVGVSSRLGISNRLWDLVAETDMTGIWAVPKRQRYLPFAAGMLTDLTSMALVSLLLFSHNRGWLALPTPLFLLLHGLVFTYTVRLIWQFYFYVRTDVYYIFVNAFNCKNLLNDTQTFLLNQLSRVIPAIRKVAQDNIPSREMRVIQYYSIFYLLGRGFAFAALIFLSLPVLWSYIVELTGKLTTSSDWYAFGDTVLFTLVFVIFEGGGFFLWIRSLVLSLIKKRS